jgi:hypothetical protein
MLLFAHPFNIAFRLPFLDTALWSCFLTMLSGALSGSTISVAELSPIFAYLFAHHFSLSKVGTGPT